MLQVCITGALGIPGSGRDRNYTRNCFVSKAYDFNVAVDRSFNLKVLVEVLSFFFIHRYIFFFRPAFSWVSLLHLPCLVE